MSDIKIEKVIEVNPNIKIGCVDIDKVIESITKNCENVEVVKEGILNTKITIKGHGCRI